MASAVIKGFTVTGTVEEINQLIKLNSVKVSGLGISERLGEGVIGSPNKKLC
jgi:hypothetical protein